MYFGEFLAWLTLWVGGFFFLFQPPIDGSSPASQAVLARLSLSSPPPSCLPPQRTPSAVLQSGLTTRRIWTPSGWRGEDVGEMDADARSASASPSYSTPGSGKRRFTLPAILG